MHLCMWEWLVTLFQPYSLYLILTGQLSNWELSFTCRYSQIWKLKYYHHRYFPAPVASKLDYIILIGYGFTSGITDQVEQKYWGCMADDKFFWFLTCSYNITSVWLVGTVGYVFLCSCCVTQIGYFLQPMDQHQRLSRCFDKLMADVTRSLDSKNRDKFTQNLTIFRHEFRAK